MLDTSHAFLISLYANYEKLNIFITTVAKLMKQKIKRFAKTKKQRYNFLKQNFEKQDLISINQSN